MHIASIGIDLGKTTFHLVALDDHGKVVVKKKFTRKEGLVPGKLLTRSLSVCPLLALINSWENRE